MLATIQLFSYLDTREYGEKLFITWFGTFGGFSNNCYTGADGTKQWN